MLRVTRLILARHGRTPWNAQGRVQGGGGLDEVGRAQAEALAKRLCREPLVAVYSSPTLRTRQTARAVAAPHGLPVRKSVLLRDLDYGVYTGLSGEELRTRDPGLWERMRARPGEVRFPEGDSLGDVRRRVARFVGRVRRLHPGGSVVAVSHDSPIRVAMSLAMGLDDGGHSREDLKSPLGSVTVLTLDQGVLEVATHNDTSHLPAAGE